MSSRRRTIRRSADQHQDQHRPGRGPGGRRTIRRPAPITQTALDDLAAKMGADSFDIFMKNLGTDDKPGVAGAKPSVYKAEMEIAAKLMDWKSQVASARQGPGQGLGRRWPGHGHPHLGRRRRPVDLHGQDPSRRRRRDVLRHAGPGHRHAHGHRPGAGRDALACRSRRSRSTSAARSIPASGALGRQHDGRRRERIAPPRRARRLRQDRRAGRQEAGGRSGDAGSGQRPRPGRGQRRPRA